MYISNKRRINCLYGRKAEKIAKEYLENRDYRCIEERYKTHYGEIDLILEKESENLIIFAEVKARRKINIDLEAILTQKQKTRCYEAALFFVSENRKYENWIMKLDLIVVYQTRVLEHIENAWQ